MFQVGVLVCGSHGKLSACLAKLRLQIKLLKRHFNHRFCGTKTIFHFLSKHYVGRIDYYLQKSIPNIKLGWDSYSVNGVFGGFLSGNAQGDFGN